MIENREHKIEHIVMSGGGLIMLPFYGYLRDSAKKGLWKLETIKTIYGTSAGAIMGMIICLNLEWDLLDNYIINRPWKHVFNINVEEVLSILTNKGLKNKDCLIKVFKPMFETKNVSLDITLKEFYEINHIDLHLFITEINTFTCIDVSHLTHPDWKLVDAVYISAAVPILFSPFYVENICYVDGGFLNNFPLLSCIQNEKCANENILPLDIDNEMQPIDTTTSLFELLLILFVYILQKLNNRSNYPQLENTVSIDFPSTSLRSINELIEDAGKREELIQHGASFVKSNTPTETTD